MLIRKIVIENVRSFLERREMTFDGNISIVIGPNGGGKTNLLDIIYIVLRRYLFTPFYLEEKERRSEVEPTTYELRKNRNTGQVFLEKHSQGTSLNQFIEVEIEISASDIANMHAIKNDYLSIISESKRQFNGNPWHGVEKWEINDFKAGDRMVYMWNNKNSQNILDQRHQQFLEYLQIYEFDNEMRAEVGKSALQMSMLYLPVNRASAGFPSSISLADYDDLSQRRSLDSTSSRNRSNIISLAVGRLAQTYRLLLEDNNVNAKEIFNKNENLQALTTELEELGYEWELTSLNALKNQYGVILKKQGSSFLVDAASSGEREILTYLFAVYALNVRDTLIIVDEPELHLHPRWQNSLFNLFVRLSNSTGNQFVVATHSPTFISPASIQYVSRVYMKDQKSDIVRLKTSELPNAKHLFNVVNSQNNESIFFSDRVLLVEGISDRIIFDRVLKIISSQAGKQRDHGIEIVSVGGKGFFPAYKKLLDACKVDSVLIADLDYIEQIGDEKIKSMFHLNENEIKKDVVDNMKSLDGAALVRHIEIAIATGSWSQAEDTWKYIKSRRIMLRESLSDVDQKIISDFIENKSKEGIFLLEKGDIEDYLPVGFKSRDLEKLIEFVNSNNFWEKLPLKGRDELSKIGRKLLLISE